uniref:Cytochrome P450 family 2 subfamily D member 93 n=1 Tax=Microcebus murinus TaxID=30608 RepID=A0A8C5Y224_MICMU
MALAVVIFLLLVDPSIAPPPTRLPRYPSQGPWLHGRPTLVLQLRRRFGDVYSLQLASEPAVVLNGLEAVREALVKHNEDTADRPPSSVSQHLGHRPHPFSPNALLNKAVGNVIASLTYGRRFEYDDQRFLRLMELLKERSQQHSGYLMQVVMALPVLLRIPWLAGKVISAQKAFMALLDELVTEHRMTRDPAQPPRDLTDAFLAEVEKAKGNPESSFNDDNLRLVVADLFSAGMETSSTTLAWALLLMILHPDVQRRVQQEIDEVIGQVRRPEMGDQAHMPYTTAVIHEVQRFADIVPLGVPHMTTRDIEVKGFLIPKGTTLLTNLSSVLKDEAVWEKPFRFHPEHFLDSQGRFVKPEAFMPFSAGRRACLGEPLARMELFLFFTCLLQRFSFSVPPGHPRPSDHGVCHFLVTPCPYQLCAVPR